MESQGLGVPTGPHGAFRDYQVDAITLEISPKVSLTKMAWRNDFILRGGRYVIIYLSMVLFQQHPIKLAQDKVVYVKVIM